MNQIRATLESEGYYLAYFRADDEAVLVSNDGDYELWIRNDDFAGFVFVIRGKGYEFVRSIEG